jgi:lipopolysaccharide transport system permease protein
LGCVSAVEPVGTGAEGGSFAAGPPRPAWDEFDLVLEPTRGWAPLRLRELWRHRELLWFLAWRDLKVRYKQTVLGAAWAIIQPLFTMIVFSLFFGRLAGLEARIERGVPYPLFTFAALVPWTFFAYALNQASDSLVGASHLIRKVYFPRLVIPLAAVVTGLADFALAFVVLVGMMLFYGVHPPGAVVLLPAFLALAMVTALGVALWLSALNVQFRDVRYTMGFLTQLWLLATPIAYPASLVPARWQTAYALNPMVGVVEGFRWALLGTAPPGAVLAASSAMALLLLVGGVFYFRRMERGFADAV